MGFAQIIDPLWGSDRAKMLGAQYLGKRKIPFERKVGIFNKRTITEFEEQYDQISTSKGDKISDDEECLRWYEHRCGLRKAVLMPGKTNGRGGGSHFALMLDGYHNVVVAFEDVLVRIGLDDPNLKDQPEVLIHFSGKGTKYGNLSEFHCYRAVLKFADEQQMRRYIRIPAGRMQKPKSVEYEGRHWNLRDDGLYYDDDDGTLLAAAVLWFLLMPSEQADFAKKNPDFVPPAEPPTELAEAIEAADFESGGSDGSDDDGDGGGGGASSSE